VTALAAGCGPAKETDPLRQLLADVAAAAEKRDVDAVAARLAPGFQGEGGLSRADTVAELRRFFALYRSIEVLLSDVAVERGEGAADARLRVDFSGRPLQIGGLQGLLPRFSAYRFEVHLTLEGSRWSIAGASWARMEGPPPSS
jgi:hypothetical protein